MYKHLYDMYFLGDGCLLHLVVSWVMYIFQITDCSAI